MLQFHKGVHSGRKQEGVQTRRSCRTSTMTLGLTVWPWVLFCLGAILPLRGRSWESASASPLLQHEPFVVVWNMPTARCHQRFGVALPLEDYAIVENQGNAFQGQNMTIFYKNKFGLYPYISPEGEYYNAGIPQKVRLKQHLERATAEITQLLQPDFHGLAVVDWEEWRPLWRRNWGPKAVYKEASEQWVWERFPDMRAKKRVYLAEVEFEGAAQELMERTLELGKELRPWGLWGFYRFPDCFNDNWTKRGNYTGECNAMEVLRNNRLMWLWEASTALYPSIYLPPKLPPAKRQSYVHHRLQEAFRVARFGLEQPLPVIAYSRVSYRHSARYLSEGSAGAVQLTRKSAPGSSVSQFPLPGSVPHTAPLQSLEALHQQKEGRVNISHCSKRCDGCKSTLHRSIYLCSVDTASVSANPGLF
ncbi:hyaluronidase-3 isoform X4 [Mauremys reevesii]|uniref:hyaluronidase-3 isoform X4 n=1 Tax=Mauremys reevesii TaxID=260615 RepID=UPI00193FFA2D|nr:hyaluronidase-3 isoform X4 [Mauremys reevesii]